MHPTTPLRYPGGKAKLAPFVRHLFELNGLCDGQYIEPYAGGAGIAMDLLLAEYVRGVHLNDASYPVYCFWNTIIRSPDYLCRRIKNVNVSPQTWKRQRHIMGDANNWTHEEVGFAFLFMNRTNHSGIISGGMIGGKAQRGEWLLDARFYRDELIKRIEHIAEYSHRIFIYCMDAEEFVSEAVNKLPGKCCVYYDPPYYNTGQRLYLNYYKPSDHARIAQMIQRDTIHPWFLTYNNNKDIRDLYKFRRRRYFTLHYSASKSHFGKEVMIFSDRLKIPKRLNGQADFDTSNDFTKHSNNINYN